MATSLGYKLNKHPIAQSFFIDEIGGIYCTKVDLFFASKDSSFPVTLSIRPMVNGYPSSQEIIPGTQVVVPGSSVNTSADATSATTFEFTEPVFLKGLTDYALVVTADSTDYKIYIAETNQFLVGSTERRVDRQPVLGSLFYSQNSATFTAAQNQDLTFKLYQAKFRHRSGTAVMHNAALSKSLLEADPISTTAASSTVSVAHYSHGLQVGNTVNLSGIDSAGVGGINYSSLVGDRTITKVDAFGYQFAADSSADSAVTGGGSGVLATKNIPFSILYPHMQVLQPVGTGINAGAKGTTGKSYAGTEVAYQKQTDFSNLQINANNEANEPYIIANSAAETSELGSGVKSMDVAVNMFSIDSNVSPMIDMQRASMTGIGYVVDKQLVSGDAINYIAETTPTNGSSASKHITTPVTLAQDAVGMKILLTANRPSSSDFQIYYRVASGDEILIDQNWVLIPEESTTQSDESRYRFREYEYIVGGQGGNLAAFTQMQLKIVFRTTNMARVPVLKDLRVIALSV